MRTILAIFLMALATQAFSEDIVPTEMFTRKKIVEIEDCDADPFFTGNYTGCSNHKICMDVKALCSNDPSIIGSKSQREGWIKSCNILASTVANRGLRCLTWQAKQDELKQRGEIANQNPSKNMMQIISNNTGVQNDIITTLQIVEGAFRKLSKSERIELQLVLKARGMYQAELDGAWGKYSRIAFAIYLAPKLQISQAENPNDLFNEIKKGFIIENLWEREDFEKDLQEIWRTDAKNKLTSGSGISSGSRSSSSSRSTSDDDSFEPFFKQMYINNELKNCLKVGNSWECD